MDAMFPTSRTKRVQARAAGRRRSRPLAAERLESRMLMAADISPALATNRFVWNGETVTARADAWIVRADASAGAMGVRAGWQTSPLGEGLFSLMAPGACVRADATATFVAAKPGFAAPGASEFTGAVHVLGIGAPAALLGRFGISPERLTTGSR